jgi:ribonuclease J
MIGLAETTNAPAGVLRDALADAMEGLPAPMRHDDEAVRDTARRVLRRALNERFGKRPLIEVQLVRL